MLVSQDRRIITIDTQFGKDELIVTEFSSEEHFSSLFTYQLNFLSANNNLSAKDVIGTSATIVFNNTDEKDQLLLNGVFNNLHVGSMTLRGMRWYRSTLVPKLWFLTKTKDCCIFQKKTVIEVIKEIFSKYAFNDYEISGLKKNYPKQEYCVQYQESAFNFISRLMEEWGIFYFFKHEKNKHVMVLADQDSVFKDCAENDIRYYTGSLTESHINVWEKNYNYHPGKYAHTDYNFEQPTLSLMSNANTSMGFANNSQYEIFNYPGSYDKNADGDSIAVIRMQENEVSHEVITAMSNCIGLKIGGKFKLKAEAGHPEKGKYVITAIRHVVNDKNQGIGNVGVVEGGTYHNQFECIPENIPFRPPQKTEKPVIYGMQTAVVTGPSNEEVFTDKYGRVKVKFHWDRKGKKDDTSSCWVRVSQHWAGKKWGTLFTPRVGQEVIVSFLEGDPNKPFITGAVYNADFMPPYPLTDNKYHSGIKTISEKGSEQTFNEIRFEDNKDKELLYLHAQKDFKREVINDENIIIGHDQTITVKNNRTEEVTEGNETISIKKGNRKVSIETGNDSLEVQKGNRDIVISMGNDSLQIKKGARDVKIMGNDSLKITTGNQTISLSAGKSSTEAMQGIELKVGQNSIKIDQTGITISGLMIKLDGKLMSEVKAGAMLTLKGAITMIN